MFNIISIFIIISIWMKLPEGFFRNPNSQMPKLIILHLESELINFGRMGVATAINMRTL
jgi:hypothetical protein